MAINSLSFSLFGNFDGVPYILAEGTFSFLLVGPFINAVSMVGMVAGSP